MHNNYDLWMALYKLDCNPPVDKPRIEALKAFLGPQGYNATADKNAIDRAKTLGNVFVSGSNPDITMDVPSLPPAGLPPVEFPLTHGAKLQDIIDIAKCRLLQAEALQKIEDIKDDEDLTAENFKYLDSYMHDAKLALSNFCHTYHLDKKEKYVVEAFDKIRITAIKKHDEINKNTESRSKKKVEDLKSDINTKKKKLEDTTNQISTALSDIEETIKLINDKQIETTLLLQTDKQSKRQKWKKYDKEALQKQIDTRQAELNVLNVTRLKLESISKRLKHRLLKASKLIDDDLQSTLNNITRPPVDIKFFDLKEGYDKTTPPSGQLFYYIDGGKFKYNIKSPDTPGVFKDEIDLGVLKLDTSCGFEDINNQKLILKELYARKHAIDAYQPYKLGEPEFGIAADTKEVESIGNILDDFHDDVARCERVIALAKKTADDPSKQLHSRLPVNTFVDVMSLADITNFNKKGEPYFKYEIIDEKTQKPRFEKDSRMQYGLEGEVITRGVKLNSGEVKRCSYKGNNDGKIQIDTKFVKSKSSGQYSVAKTNYTVIGTLTQEQEKLCALRYARELLLQYNENDPKSKIIIRAGRGKNAANAQDAQQHAIFVQKHATLVYAALLMLTSPENSGADYIHLPSDKLIIDVKGVDRPKMFSWAWDKKQEFINEYFPGAIDGKNREELRKSATEEYRTLRQSIYQKNKKHHDNIVENAADDIYHTSLSKKP